MPHKIYVASSWRNIFQPHTVALLREWGHEVYDFRNPAPTNNGFRWTDLDPEWKDWSVGNYRVHLRHPVAEEGYNYDMDALEWADLVVLLLPSGASAHSEAAWKRGNGAPAIVHIPEIAKWEPELMYKMFNAVTMSDSELHSTLLGSIGEIGRMSLARRHDYV